MADLARTIAALTQLRALLPSQRDLSPDGLKLAARALEDLSDAEIATACARAARECEWFPAPAVLRRLAGCASPEYRAGAAWEAVLAAIRTVGAYRTPDLEPAAAAAVERIGGWSALCAREAEWLHEWGRKAFCAEYASVLAFGGAPARIEGRHGQSLERPDLRALPAPGGQDEERVSAPPEALAALRRLGAGS